MIVRKSTVQRIEIIEAPRLDPIRVYLEDYEPGKGRITISCYDAAWVGYWGAMGKSTIAEFFIGGYADCLAGNLGSARGLKKNRIDQDYLIRVIEAVQNALKQAGGRSAGAEGCVMHLNPLQRLLPWIPVEESHGA